MNSLRENVDALARHVADLEPERSTDAFANDVYEAAWYWRDLGNWVLENNTRTNFPARAREELASMDDLRRLLLTRSSEEQTKYAPMFETAEKVLRVVESVHPSKGGHLGVLRVIREQFGFLQTEHSFAIAKEERIGIRFSSGKVYLELEWAKNYHMSCSFGLELNPRESFWIDDLLFMYGDPRYRTLPEELALNTESDVERWFQSLADTFKQYGNDVLSNKPGIFEKLEQAQAERDREFTREMNSQYGH